MKNLLRTVIPALLCLSVANAKAQVPVLNSYPSASATIFLDFDGHTIANTSWNWNGPFSVGGAGLNSTQITEVFNRVAEDYRPFNINITTDSTKFLAAPLGKRMRVVLTVDYQWYGTSGGVAFVESFTWTDNSPCFVFTSLHNYNVKNISEASSHEAGHTLGLYHQSLYDASCVKLAEYHAGVGSGEIGWAPIMGNGYYRNMTLWNNGQNSEGCSVYQNDLQIITTINGFSYRNDDHNSAFNQSTNVNFSNNQFNVSGVVERNTDQDLFRFTQPAYGRFQLNAIPYNVGTGNSGSDLDLQVTLFSGSQTQLGVFNPGTLLNSIIDTVMGAGNYYLRIEGKGNIYAPNYASLGSYSLQGTFTAGNPLPLRRLELTGQLLGEQHKLSWLIDADEQVVEQVLEISTDGTLFTSLSNPANEARLFTYRPYVSGSAQYRVKVTFDNGRTHYSNVVTLRQTGAMPKPRLVSNLVSQNQVQVTSPGNYEYFIYDLHGKAVAKGSLVQGANQIQLPALTGGMYMIRYVSGHELWMEKFIRQ
jgi:hypothetical protein